MMAGFSILDRLDEAINCGRSLGFDMEGCEGDMEKLITGIGVHRGVNFLGIQETKMCHMDLVTIRTVWGNSRFDFACSLARGLSGGILCVWDPTMFVKSRIVSHDHFVAVEGNWCNGNVRVMIITMYAPQDANEKRVLWFRLYSLVSNFQGESILMGDFNVVRAQDERLRSIFNTSLANDFNEFILDMELIDLPLGGYQFTWVNSTALKMRKIDRFLITEGLLDRIHNLSANILDKGKPDHRPIFLNEAVEDYGPSPFHFFHSWMECEEFDELVKKSWEQLCVGDTNLMVLVKKKFQRLKQKIRAWSLDKLKKALEDKTALQTKIRDIDARKNMGNVSPDDLVTRRGFIKDLAIITKAENMDLAQRAKIRWEKSKPFVRERPRMLFAFSKILSAEQKRDLEETFFREEIKKAVLDCGNEKSSSPDGFTFDFFKKYWELIETDLVGAINHFHKTGKIQKGCNASFITLIPKVNDPVFIKDYHPISLIRSQYKIIGKLLANWIALVVEEIVSMEAFVKGGEKLWFLKLISRRRMIRFVGSFLLEVMEKMGFGNKWCAWIRGCLESSMASVLVNGSPTDEFQVHRGLRQGDPLSPFLFILVMEGLHMVIENAMSAGRLLGIQVGIDNIAVSHLFYADDAVFLREWNNTNINNIVLLLRCFFLSPGLKINLMKCKLMGVGVSTTKVQHMAATIGCEATTLPFVYLGAPVGENMTRVEA
ncbi:RNA-directed DNA polymerase, eukaryota [Tanacetum coccineum]